MAQFDAYVDSSLSSQAGTGGNRLTVPGLSPLADDMPPQWQLVNGQEGNIAKVLAANYDEAARVAGAPVAVRAQFAGYLGSNTGDDWFERIHVLPHHIDTGIILVLQNYAVEIYNSYRYSPRTLSSYVNNAGAGLVMNGLPPFPYIIEEQDNLLLNLDVFPDGPPTIKGTLDFTLDAGVSSILIEGIRAVIFPLEPVIPIVERLEFRTDVLTKRDGKEQRASLRRNPRQTFDLVYELDGYDRAFLDTRVFAAQAKPFGVPVWFEPALLTVAASIGNTVITVDSTAYADFRVGSLAILWSSTTVYEAQVVQAIGATTITFESALLKNFPVNTRVMPVRTVMMSPQVRGEKYPKSVQRTRLKAAVVDEGFAVGSTAAFPVFNSKVLLSDPNAISGQLNEGYDRRTTVVDSETGLMEFFSGEVVSRRGSVKTFITRTRQRLWEVRQLLHALRGRAISFYIPTFFDDLIPLTGLTVGGTTINVSNIGLTDLGGTVRPHDALRVLLKNNTAVTRLIASVSEIDASVEQVNITGTWGVDAFLSDIDRVEYVEKVRIDSDEIEIRHLDALGQAVIAIPTKTVNE